MGRRFRNEVLLGVFILAAAAVLGYFSIKVGGLKMKEGIRVEVVFDDASGLVEGADVKVAGVRVGTVKEMAADFDKAVVTMLLEPEAGIRRDAEAFIRSRSLLGEKYVELMPVSRSAPLLQDGDRIELSHTPVEIDQLINSLGPVLTEIDPRDVGVILRTFANSISGKEEEIQQVIVNLGELMATLNRSLSAGGPGVGSILANLDQLVSSSGEIVSSKKPSIMRMIDDAGALFAYLSENSPSIAEDIGVAASDLRVITDSIKERSPELASRIDTISGNLEGITGAVAVRSPRLARSADVLLANMAEASDELPELVEAINQLSPELTIFLRKMNSVLDKVEKIDKKAIEKILREMGVKVHIF